MYYDPMIAKLCTWAPDRAAAIAAMRTALDGFEVEGIGHNLPFLSAVMDHPRFVDGRRSPRPSSPRNIPRASRASTLPEPMLRRVAAAAAAMHRVARDPARADLRADGQPRAQGRRRLGGDAAGRRPFPVTIDADRSGRDGRLRGRRRGCGSTSDWTPGPAAGAARRRRRAAGAEGRRGSPSGYRMRVRGADLQVTVLSPRHGRAGRADAGEGAARHLEAPALPDAGAGRADRRRRGRRGLRRPGAGHGRGDEDGERAARRAQGAGREDPRQGRATAWRWTT